MKSEVVVQELEISYARPAGSTSARLMAGASSMSATSLALPVKDMLLKPLHPAGDPFSTGSTNHLLFTALSNGYPCSTSPDWVSCHIAGPCSRPVELPLAGRDMVPLLRQLASRHPSPARLPLDCVRYGVDPPSQRRVGPFDRHAQPRVPASRAQLTIRQPLSPTHHLGRHPGPTHMITPSATSDTACCPRPVDGSVPPPA